jgi:hypothetical protein
VKGNTSYQENSYHNNISPHESDDDNNEQSDVRNGLVRKGSDNGDQEKDFSNSEKYFIFFFTENFTVLVSTLILLPLEKFWRLYGRVRF